MDLREFFEAHPKVALAFSGGVDSSYLLYAAQAYGADVHAYFVSGAFQPEFEKQDARRLAEQVGAALTVLPVDVLANRQVVENPQNRCYFCKRVVFSTIAEAAARDGYEVLLDGTNASDDASDRPGMRALAELKVLSPLRLAGLTKARIRELSHEVGLFTWDKPSYACLATRIPTGEPITQDKLSTTEWAESYLMGLGLSDFRVRWFHGAAKIQVRADQMPLVMERREEILSTLRQRYAAVLLDLEAR